MIRLRPELLLGLVVLAAGEAAVGAGLDALNTPSGGWPVTLPGRVVRQVALDEDWSDASKLVLTLRADPAPVRPLQVLVSLVVGDDWWYQSAELVSVGGDKPHRIALDLGHLSSDWTPNGHLRAWDGYARQRVRAAAVSVFSPAPYAGIIHITDAAVERVAEAGANKLFVYDVEVLTDEPRSGLPLELAFRLSEAYRNPFDPGLVAVSLRRDGREVFSAPAFFYQGYRRGADDVLRPVGAACWRARLIAPGAGRFEWDVSARKGGGGVRLGGGELFVAPARRVADVRAAPPLAPDDLVPFVLARRAGARDPVFALAEGKWGPGAEQPKEPLVRAWRVPLEWTERWGRYQGLGRYNLENAWTFDQLLAKAESAGFALPLALNADEPFQGQGMYNWFSNPLAAHMGGSLTALSQYFTDRRAEEFFQRQVRYVAARWSSSPGVSRFELWMSVPANFAEGWHERAAAFLGTVPLAGKAVVSRHPQSIVPGERRAVTGFEREWGAWKAETRISTGTRIEWAADFASEGSKSLKVVAPFPGEAAVYSEVGESWNGYDRLVFDVYVPKDAPCDMRAMVYVRERDWWWYETLLDPLLRPGDWTKLVVDISPDSTVWAPRGHRRTWDAYVAQNIREMGIRVFGARKYDGPVYIDNIELWPDPHWPPPLRVTELATSAAKVGQYEKFEVSFRLSQVFANPFDPRQADVRGHFVSPAGRHIEVPGFFYQGYSRELVDGAEQLAAEGRSCWKVRFATGEMGKWTCFLKVNGTELLKESPSVFEVAASDNPGFVRRSVIDDQWLEFTTGKFFYPIGHNVRSPSDGREPYKFNFQLPESKGTFIYDDYFKSMAAAGENVARIWMCSWWCGLEWHKNWRGFGGIGVYNMENGWRLDYLVDQATKHGLYLSVDTTNHGQYSTDIDHEWENNPYNAANGGFLQNARDFFTSDQARQKFEDRLRYTVARWGYSTRVMQWTIFSEVEFVEEYWRYSSQDSNTGSAKVASWLASMASCIKANDPFGHIVTTHVSHPWRGHDIWAKTELEIIMSNAYSKYWELGQVDVVQTLSKIYNDKLKQFGRPIIVAEYGGHWMTNTPQALDAELHAGLWATAMMPYAGNTGFWWWLHIHFANRYSHYTALANYMKGEDRRGKGLVQGNFLVTSHGDALKAVGLQSQTAANVWVYHRQVPVSLEAIPPVQDATVGFAGLADGAYRVEFWDTYKGVKTGEATVRCVGNQMTVKLPVVQNDLALKVALEQAVRESPSR